MSGRESLEWEVKWNYVGWGGIDTIASGKPGLIHIQGLSLHIRSTTKKKTKLLFNEKFSSLPLQFSHLIVVILHFSYICIETPKYF